ncbi:hypothetical protein, partial [Neisseria sp. P0013.S004]|uniref:hypothetical protein n=1 Tax=Neisseria sp. P0013.S004 TaxID=3436740 RepID=UPI003F7EC3B2
MFCAVVAERLVSIFDCGVFFRLLVWVVFGLSGLLLCILLIDLLCLVGSVAWLLLLWFCGWVVGLGFVFGFV